jgi:ferredoxin
MKSVQIDPHEDPVLIKTNSRVSDAMLAVREKLLMACGGKGLCATCHVYVTEGADCLSPVTPRERMSLAMLCDQQPSSRLACQAKVLRDGVRVSFPKGRFIDGTGDLERLIGRRAEENILHPVNGSTLIGAGKIITRSRIAELSFVDVDLAEMRTRSLSIDTQIRRRNQEGK